MVVGVEVHIRLNTLEKLFSRAKNATLGLKNSRIDLYDLGVPGAMPVLNEAAVVKALQLARYLGSTVAKSLTFDRKHYRYPDLPLGFQLTQFKEPLGRGGSLPSVESARVSLKQLHLEMDAAKTNRVGDS